MHAVMLHSHRFTEPAGESAQGPKKLYPPITFARFMEVKSKGERFSLKPLPCESRDEKPRQIAQQLVALCMTPARGPPQRSFLPLASG